MGTVGPFNIIDCPFWAVSTTIIIVNCNVFLPMFTTARAKNFTVITTWFWLFIVFKYGIKWISVIKYCELPNNSVSHSFLFYFLITSYLIFLR
jgi:hypothetical protein